MLICHSEKLWTLDLGESILAKKRKKIATQTASGIIHALERVARLMRSAEFDLGLNPAQWEALRYISRANRFSNSPIALTKFLGATKGTISQTLIALERKQLITKTKREGERRSIALGLTDDGIEFLEQDPWQQLITIAEGFKPKQIDTLGKTTGKLLTSELDKKALPSFGICHTCRFFREKGAPKKSDGPHFCLLFEQALSKSEVKKICCEHEVS